MRLFTGISLPQPILETMEQVLEELRPAADLHWYPVSNLHITTKFIGAWPEERGEALDEALRAVRGPSSIPIHIARYGYFPNPHRPHTFFAGVRPTPELVGLAGAIDAALQGLGHAPEDREYSPHLTLARIKGQDITGLRLQIAEHSAKLDAQEFGTFEATEFHLYESVPGPAGSRYQILKTYPLKEAV